jgi:hypothetical protein
VSAPDIASALDLPCPSPQLDILCEVLSALSTAAVALDLEERQRQPAAPIRVHDVSLFLFALLFSKETSQRSDSVEVWPDTYPGAGFGSSGFGGFGSFSESALLSPTRERALSMSLSMRSNSMSGASVGPACMPAGLQVGSCSWWRTLPWVVCPLTLCPLSVLVMVALQAWTQNGAG